MTIQANGVLLDFETPKIMGVLNLTPDSFFDGGNYKESSLILKRVEEMIEDGMDILDIGGMSSRPGAKMISAEEEQNRILGSLKLIRQEFPQLLISIDTIFSETLDVAVKQGIQIANDINAGVQDPSLFSVVEQNKLAYVLMHMKGTPDTMQDDVSYSEPIVDSILKFMANQLRNLKKRGIHDVILDPGFGFGKSVEDNFKILKSLRAFKIFNCPILVGISRKSMICKTLGVDPKSALNGTSALHMMALENGGDILRVHDVKEANEVRALYLKYRKV